jgi:hypothetical protein
VEYMGLPENLKVVGRYINVFNKTTSSRNLRDKTEIK